MQITHSGKCVFTCTNVCLSGPRNRDYPIAMRTHTPRSEFLNTILHQKKNQVLFQEWLVLGLAQGKTR